MIELHQVSKRYGAQVLLDRVDLRIPTGMRAGVVGPNGAGKSTFFDLIADDAEPDGGTITRMRGIRIGYLRQQPPRLPADTQLLSYVEASAPGIQTLREEIRGLESRLGGTDEEEQRLLLHQLGDLQMEYESKGGYDAHARAAAALAGLGFTDADFSKPLTSFSGGWRMRAALGAALLTEPDLLLLDEPGNYLDLPAVEWLRRRLEAFRGTLVMISHDRYLLESLCQTTLEVARGAITRYPGPYSFYAREREKRLTLALARQANEQRRRDQIERFIERFRYKSTLASRVQSRIHMLEKMEKTEAVQIARGMSSFRIAEPPASGLEVLQAEGISFRYAPDAPWILRGLDLRIQRGEKIAVVGSNGAGKTTLLRVLAGQLKPEEGTIRLGKHVIPGYQSQDSADTMPPNLTCYEILKAAAPDAFEKEIRTILGAFGFSGEAIQKRVDVLSGGERIRLAFARILIRPPNLLMLDEPTTHLDIESREALQDALEHYSGTVLLVSHDVTFVRAVAKIILEVRGGAEIQRYPYGYDAYREKIAGRSDAIATNTAGIQADTQTEEKEQRRTRYRERKTLEAALRKQERALDAVEAEMTALETERDELHHRLADAETPPPDRIEAGRRLKEVEAALEDAAARWEETGAQRDETAAALND